jgi:hypothetical protein
MGALSFVERFSEVGSVFLLGIDRYRCRVCIHECPRAMGCSGQQVGESRDAWEAHFSDEQRCMGAHTSVLQENRRDGLPGEKDRVGWQQAGGREDTAAGDFVEWVNRDVRKGIAQADRDIPNVVTLVLGDLRLHQKEALLPAQEHRLYGAARAHQVLCDLSSQLISQGGITQNELMSPEDLGKSRVDFLLYPRCQGEEIVRDPGGRDVETQVLFFDSVLLDVFWGIDGTKEIAM